jgi:6-phosphogluconolactonase
MKVLLTILLLNFFSSYSQERYMLVGTYSSPKSYGIHVYRFNTKTGFAKRVSVAETPNPSFLTVSSDQRYVYAVNEPHNGKGGNIVAYSFDKRNGILTLIDSSASGGDTPCHVELDKTGKWLFAANYSSGSISVLPVGADGSLGTATVYQHEGSGPHPRQKGPHTHGSLISKDNKTLFVTDLGIDKVLIYSFDVRSGKLTPASPAFVQCQPGSGPRLMTFHPNGKWAYVIEELSGTVSSFNWKDGKLFPAQRISTMAEKDTGFAGSGDIHISPDGRFLYASNRGEINNIAIFSIDDHGKLSLVGHQPALGKTPRNFSIDPGGNYLLCENQNSDIVIIFKIDKETGLLTDNRTRMTMGKPVCIQWIGD